jgi:hypothetical protein
MRLKSVCILLIALYLTTVSAEGLIYIWENNTLTGTETIAATGYAQSVFKITVTNLTI